MLIEKTTDIEEILKSKEVEKFYSEEMMEKSDQDISDFLKGKETDEDKRNILFNIIQKIKIEKSIDKINDEVESEDNIRNKEKIRCLFEKILEPDSIVINKRDVCIKYSFEEKSKLNEKIKELEMWDADNVISTISEKTGVPSEDIGFVNSVSSYIEFISEFNENTYVSRGQKDCSFELKPSLYRVYENSYAGHSSDYEEAFRQKVLFYDDSTEGKNEEEIRAYGQHYGLPTNYLDFTEAHLISLLFAVEDYQYIENHSIVYFVDSRAYNRDTVKEDRKLIDFSDEELKKTVEKQGRDKSYFIKVGNCNERIHFQKGCFLKVEQNDDLKIMYEKYTKIAVIDKCSKEQILKELFKLGITFENIYPDKDNMVKTIRFMKEHM
jgi:hypothetical protein